MTLRSFVFLIAAMALASCGAKTVGHEAAARMSLTSSAFSDGQPIPLRYTCDGANQAPDLSWGEPPAGTRSFAMIMVDPDAPGGTFRHWGVFDIPASARSIDGGHHLGTEAVNDFGKRGYGGPCPPRGHGPHHYQVKLFALDVDRLGLGADAKAVDVERAASNRTLAVGELVGTYQRK